MPANRRNPGELAHDLDSLSIEFVVDDGHGAVSTMHQSHAYRAQQGARNSTTALTTHDDELGVTGHPNKHRNRRGGEQFGWVLRAARPVCAFLGDLRGVVENLPSSSCCHSRTPVETGVANHAPMTGAAACTRVSVVWRIAAHVPPSELPHLPTSNHRPRREFPDPSPLLRSSGGARSRTEPTQSAVSRARRPPAARPR